MRGNITRIDELGFPKSIIFGNGALSKVGKEAKKFKGKKILVVTDKKIEDVGIIDKARGYLEKENLIVNIFDEVYVEPTLELMRKVTNLVRESPPDMVVGVGGGSCLDAAKVASIMTTNLGDPYDYCAMLPNPFEDKVKHKGAPMILIPTTAGTGSEFTNGAVVTIGEYKTWIGTVNMWSDVSIVDPSLTVTLPPKFTAGCGMDALSHAIEGFMVTIRNPLTDAFALQAMKLVAENLRRAYHFGEDLETRWNMSWAASIAGYVAAYTVPATPGHCIAEALGPKYKIPHGLMCGLTLPYVMEYNLSASMDRLALVAQAMGIKIDGLSLREAAFKAVESVIELMGDVDLPTSLKEVDVPKKDLKEFAEYLVNDRQRLYDLPKMNPRKLTMKNVNLLLEKMWEGKIGDQ